MTIRKCECCAMEREVYVASLPGIPMSLAMCAECRNAGAVPYDILTAMVWLGEVRTDDSWALAVAHYHGRSSTEFESDCANLIDKLESDLRAEQDGDTNEDFGSW